MSRSRLWVACLMGAIAFGTAWAVRGKFGHEQGAAWAGAIGALSILLVAKRPDWYDRMFKIALVAAFGWGLSGMISYGQIVGYAMVDDPGTVVYGLLMLLVIGILYGFIGGGLLGFALTDTGETSVRWSLLITEMVAFGLLAYGLLVNQLGWLMTPPRSELWAACLGACIPIAWRALRKKDKAVMKVATLSALGAGFGFATGNILQVLGRESSLPFNFWNVMEYSIGFWGGLGMTYAILTSSWPTLEKEPRQSNILPAILLFVFIPFVVWDQSFPAVKLDFITEMGGSEQTIVLFQWLAALIIAIAAVPVFTRYTKTESDYVDVRNVFLLSLGSYTLLSFLRTGITVHPLEQYLYLVNILVVLWVAPRAGVTVPLRSGISSGTPSVSVP